MAEDSDLEKSEPASPKRLEEARERGQVARSPELTTFAVLLAAGAGMFYLGRTLVGKLGTIMTLGLSVDRSVAFQPDAMADRLLEASVSALLAFAPLLTLLSLVAILAPLSLSGWLFSAGALGPNFSRLNPASGLARMFSVHSLVELGKAVAKALVVGGVAFWVLLYEIEPILGLAGEPTAAALGHLGRLLAYTFLAVVGSMGLIVAIDVPFQIWDHARQLRMTKEDVRQEQREQEGDPQIKARIRQLQRERARQRMMSEVPKADVVVTNPTDFAVALRYREGAMRAPTVVAKGAAQLAERIVAVARDNRVPVVRVPPLTRALHAHAELGREIPGPLYTAVAEVLAYVYQLERHEIHGGAAPELPGDIAVPPELDPALEGADS
ncbi:MAG: flagellar biosynthesis protein FlhB [Betaproteobacteria bacterium]